ncbi:hypothetical protein RHMOL_Rhmol10G0217700 [Rhododendron molle]|uniref:Uncharacterized protein n=1 Tax=Rhododendron molle TaxID=49168 RepID=A0ACC0M524_RHOML|nr:hypothetical protein RHMOL_Rhmol10G0217700 [Rhododendron molle]
MNETQQKKSLGRIRESRANCGLPNPPLPDEVAGAEEEPQDVHRSTPLHAPPLVSVLPPPHWSMSYEEYRSMQASHEHLCRCINASELTSARNHYDLVSMFRVFTSQESCLRLYLLFLFRSLFFLLIMRNGRSCSARVQQFVNYISDLETRVHVKKPLASRNQSNKQVDYWSQLAQGTLKINVDGAFNTRMFLFLTISIFEQDLKGKVVLPDFWTYCCINCMHVLSDLEFLEKKYKDIPFTVVGVHFAKFDNEKDLEAIRNAILRYGITHLVLVVVYQTIATCVSGNTPTRDGTITVLPNYFRRLWYEIGYNVKDCPEGFYPVTMRACNKLWKDHKGKSNSKDNYYEPHNLY